MARVRLAQTGVQQRIAVGYAGLALLAAGSVAVLDPGLLRFAPISVAELTRIVTPLVVISLFIERAIEVFVTAWREGEREELDLACAAEGLGDEDRALRRQTLAAYRDETRFAALFAGAALGIAVSALGVRALELMVDADMLAALERWQRLSFAAVDVLLTGALLAGGADGMHRMVSVFTAFMERSAGRLRVR